MAKNAASMELAEASIRSTDSTLWLQAEQALPTRRLKTVRDRRWAESILGARKRHGRGWAAVLVGAAHATRFDTDTLASVLDAERIRFRRRFLALPPWVSRTN
jgi:hypothetical protein